MTCPACGYANRAEAPFCLECGATLSLNNDEGASLSLSASLPVRNEGVDVASRCRPAQSLPAMLSPLRWSMELRIVVALLLLLVGFQFMVNQGVAADSAAYDAARAAIAQQQWHLAARQLAPLAASGFRDASVQLVVAKQQVVAFDNAWQAGVKANAAGERWQALQSFNEAAAIEPTYVGLSAQLTSVRAALGQIVYRLPATTNAKGGLWLADVDGRNEVQLPDSDAHTTIFAVDADGDRLLYANLVPSPTVSNSLSLDFHLYYTTRHTDQQFSVPISGTALFSRNDLIANYQAAFFAGGVVVSEGGFGDRSDTPGGFRGWVFDSAGELHEFHAALVARPAPADDALYIVSGKNQQRDAISRYGSSDDRPVAVEVNQTITHLYVLGNRLFYSTYNQNDTAVYLLAAPLPPRQLLKLPNSPVGIIYGSLSLYMMPAPDGRSAFITVPSGDHYILNFDSDLLYGLSGLPAGGHCSVRFASFSPDGQHLLLGGVIFYSTLSPSSEGPRYDWIGVSDLSGSISHVATFTGSIDGGGFLNSSTVYYYRSPGNGGTGNYSEVVVSGIAALGDKTPPLPNLNLQAAGNWLPYPVSLVDDHTLLLAGKIGDYTAVYAIGSDGKNYRPLRSSATSVWLLKNGQITPVGFP
jgi:hypothetical protein